MYVFAIAEDEPRVRWDGEPEESVVDDGPVLVHRGRGHGVLHNETNSLEGLQERDTVVKVHTYLRMYVHLCNIYTYLNDTSMIQYHHYWCNTHTHVHEYTCINSIYTRTHTRSMSEYVHTYVGPTTLAVSLSMFHCGSISLSLSPKEASR